MPGEDPTNVERVMRKIRWLGGKVRDKVWVCNGGVRFPMKGPNPGNHAGPAHPNRAPLTEKGFKHILACLEAMKAVLGDEVDLAALVHVAAAMHDNYVAFEHRMAQPAWWYDIVTGLPHPVVKNSPVEVWNRPGRGVELVHDKAVRSLKQRTRASSTERRPGSRPSASRSSRAPRDGRCGPAPSL